MADTKITALTAITTVDPAADVLPIVDVSDTSMAASGTTKKITSNQILGAGGTATLASATITGDLTVDTNTLKVNSSANRVGVLTASPESELDVRGLIAVRGTPTFPTTGVGPELFWSPGNSNSNLYSYNRGTSAWAEMAYGALNHVFQISGVNAMFLNSSGLGVGVVPSAGKGALQLSSGINFPATQVASSDANTLDDYEEGTFTPTIASGSGTPTTVTVNSAGYTKIGRQVTVNIDFSIIDKGTANGVFLFSLPFAASSSFAPAGSFKESSVIGYMGPIYYVSTAYAGLVFYNDTVIWVNNYRVRGTFTYFV